MKWCMVCRKNEGIIWCGNLLLCGLCERASAPVRLTGADIAAALTPPANTKPVVSAKRAIEALERSARR